MSGSDVPIQSSLIEKLLNGMEDPVRTYLVEAGFKENLDDNLVQEVATLYANDDRELDQLVSGLNQVQKTLVKARK